MTVRSVWIIEPHQIEIRSAPVPEPERNQVRVRTSVSGISSGTELLAYRGLLPGHNGDDAIDPHAGVAEYPMRTGYCSVGVIDSIGPGVAERWLHQRVFTFQPHQDCAVVSPDSCIAIPDQISDQLATFIPNLETAVGLVMDAAPVIGERVVVLGQGIVGLLVTRLLSRFPLALLAAADSLPRRRDWARRSGADLVIDPAAPDQRAHLEDDLAVGGVSGADLVLELSGNPDALNDAISLSGYGGRIVAGSWYGTKPAAIDLGGRFHRNRISLVSSQVSTIDPRQTGRWTKDRRMEQVLRLLRELDLDDLISHRFPLEQAADAFTLLDTRPDEALQVVLTCDDEIR